MLRNVNTNVLIKLSLYIDMLCSVTWTFKTSGFNPTSAGQVLQNLASWLLCFLFLHWRTLRTLGDMSCVTNASLLYVKVNKFWKRSLRYKVPYSRVHMCKLWLLWAFVPSPSSIMRNLLEIQFIYSKIKNQYVQHSPA